VGASVALDARAPAVSPFSAAQVTGVSVAEEAKVFREANMVKRLAKNLK